MHVCECMCTAANYAWPHCLATLDLQEEARSREELREATAAANRNILAVEAGVVI